MPSQLVCRPEQDLPVAVLRISGTLDRVTGGALGAAVRRSLSVQPAKVLLDFTRLRVDDPAALDGLGALVCQAEEFPAAPIVVCGAGPRTRAALAAVPDCARLEMAADCDNALAEAENQPSAPTLRVRLRPVPEACRQVRHLVAQACTAWQRTDVTSTATLVATELVANVVRHAHTTMDFTLGLRDGRLTVAVRDRSRLMPRALDPAVTDAGGRGLRLVRDLTDAWGVLPVPDGKVVWTQLATGAAV
ncbi:ATP-binding protein [Actinoplanes sp. NEAU-A12]|uniref:ATP-binding protein n=1 Tax=Actinoplanes sandaracinus TaxID=3045177 RepID=A0ABT6WN74_9ACTN|nr:ATP-binding protein [Actinoplanes sandaracinus]MDI6101179.1 ATP-binding protein [Actinoplanes sandaracinus]